MIAPRSFRHRLQSAALMLTVGGLMTACASGPVRPVPKATAKPELPKWYPEAPWTEAASGPGERYVQGKVVFATGKSKVRQPSKQVLEQLVNYLNKTPDISMVRLEGHTDTRGSEASNQTLSQKRVMAVADFLVDQGIEHTRLIAVAFGETRPLGPNDSSSGRQENRRTEFHIAEVSGQRFLGQDPTNGGLVLRIKSKAEREAEAEVGTVPTIEPPPFKPTGDIIEDVKMPDREKLLADDAPSNDGPQGTLPDKTN